MAACLAIQSVRIASSCFDMMALPLGLREIRKSRLSDRSQASERRGVEVAMRRPKWLRVMRLCSVLALSEPALPGARCDADMEQPMPSYG